MENCIDQKLLGEVCTINTNDKYLVGRISKIYPDKFAINLLSISKNQEISGQQVEIRIETLDNRIYFYVALIESQHILPLKKIIFLKPVSELREDNKRQYKRLKVETFLDHINIFIRPFPPINTNWLKGRLIDISQGGIQIKSNTYLSRGEIIEAKVGSPFFQKNELIICRIVNIKDELNEYHISIQFLNLDEAQMEKIDRYISSALEYIKNLSEKNA